MSEYIGSRIALISKSDIKYIGTLHEINSENSTVALENVKSQGTEGRRNGQDEVPPSETIYEYIVFRGSDVKELSIVEAPKENKQPAAVPNDPAILGSARPQQYQQPPPPQQPDHFRQPPPMQQFPGQYDYQQGPPPQFPPQSRFQAPGGPHGFPGQPGAVPGYNPGFAPPPNYNMGYMPPPPGAFGHPHHPPPPPGGFSPAQQNPIAPPGQRTQPREPQAQRAQQKPAEMSGTPAPAQPKANANPATEPKSATTAQAAATAAATSTESKPLPKKAPNNRVAVPLPATAKPASKPAAKPETPAAPQSYADATSAATAAVAEAMAKLNTGAPTTETTNRAYPSRPQDGATRGRGRGRGTGAPRGGRPPQRGVDVPKEDFDFQQANAKFNKEDLVKEAIATGSPVTSPGANGELENGADDDVIIPPKPAAAAAAAAEKSYNRQTSFFDNISSDLKDRSEAPAFDGRSMRREERDKNFQTFGQVSVDGSHRGGFRGRGRGRGRGQGGFHRGAGRGRGPAETAAVLASTS